MDQNQRREYLFKRDLELEKNMEKTIKDAQPKPKPDMTLKLLKPIKINTDLLTGTPEYQAQKQLSDLELEQEIHNTITNAKLFKPGETVAVGASGGKVSQYANKS